MKIEVKDLYQHLGKTLYVYFKEMIHSTSRVEDCFITGQLIYIGKYDIRLNVDGMFLSANTNEIITIFDDLEEFSAYIMYLTSPN